MLEWASRHVNLNVSRNKGKLKTTEAFHVATIHRSTPGLTPLRGKHVSFLADKLHEPVQSFSMHSHQPSRNLATGNASHEPLYVLLVVTVLNFISRGTPHRSLFGLSVSNSSSGNISRHNQLYQLLHNS